eukprot:TRINITY_DN25090_c0_g1_i1.p1 TRINITY_DN25090_c0_g1~~TRINITY_DN25090_c0_g1_i1.p1  ORF type:complete len:626 (-),score=112.46 TRINITY_DN25090_c0_g1_i1:17-1894(-)
MRGAKRRPGSARSHSEGRPGGWSSASGFPASQVQVISAAAGSAAASPSTPRQDRKMMQRCVVLRSRTGPNMSVRPSRSSAAKAAAAVLLSPQLSPCHSSASSPTAASGAEPSIAAELLAAAASALGSPVASRRGSHRVMVPAAARFSSEPATPAPLLSARRLPKRSEDYCLGGGLPPPPPLRPPAAAFAPPAAADADDAPPNAAPAVGAVRVGVAASAGAWEAPLPPASGRAPMPSPPPSMAAAAIAAGVARREAAAAASPNPLPSFENWRLDLDVGGGGAVRVSEFADFRPLQELGGGIWEAYGRPVNKRDLGHRCYHCRRPFSTLGEELVAELHGGPTQRFHLECWQRRNDGEQPVVLRRCPSSTSAAEEADGVVGGGDGSGTPVPICSDIVSAYADEWRRQSLEGRSNSSRASSRPSAPPSRLSVLDGLISYEDGRGERRIARGFGLREMEVAAAQWAYTAAADEECAICFISRAAKPLCLPCGHAFCAECVIPWLRRCALCPMCRRDLRPSLEAAMAGGNAAGPSRQAHSVPPPLPPTASPTPRTGADRRSRACSRKNSKDKSGGNASVPAAGAGQETAVVAAAPTPPPRRPPVMPVMPISLSAASSSSSSSLSPPSSSSA